MRKVLRGGDLRVDFVDLRTTAQDLVQVVFENALRGLEAGSSHCSEWEKGKCNCARLLGLR